MASLSPASPATVLSTQTSLIVYTPPKDISIFVREQAARFLTNSSMIYNNALDQAKYKTYQELFLDYYL